MATDYDVIIVGSGAAGGMASFQLAKAGIKTLLLEAGKSIDMYKTFKTMEWPYATERRRRMEPYEHSLNVAEYNMLDRPYGAVRLCHQPADMAGADDQQARGILSGKKRSGQRGCGGVAP